jgi:hypothetical protein
MFTERSGVFHRALAENLTTHKEAPAMRLSLNQLRAWSWCRSMRGRAYRSRWPRNSQGSQGTLSACGPSSTASDAKLGAIGTSAAWCCGSFWMATRPHCTPITPAIEPIPRCESYFERVGCGALLQNSQTSQISQNRSGEQRQPVAIIGPRYSMTADGPRYTMTAENPDGLD